jgi:phospholipase C
MNQQWSVRRSHLSVLKQVISTVMALQLVAATPFSASASPRNAAPKSPDRKQSSDPITPIKHVIIIIGENRSFDHIYATYTPKGNQSISNLFSKGIINADGTPGPNFSQTAQFSTTVNGTYSISPTPKTPYNPLPPAMTDGAPKSASDVNPPPFASIAAAEAAESDLFPSDEPLLLTGATGLNTKSIDTRIANAAFLANGVFPLAPLPYDSYTGDPVHRFYQMWQQFDCSAGHITSENPSGCLADLLPFVETTIGTGNGTNPQPAGFTQLTTGEGANAMSFYNMAQGDAPFLKSLTDEFNSSDNFHQAVMGGTMVQHMMLGYADIVPFSDGQGHIAVPPVTQIENPNPQPGSNNYYTNDGGGKGTYSNCSDTTQPGVAPIVNYLQSLPRPVNPRCASGNFYPLNNENPAIGADGTVNSTGTVPPTTLRHIGDELSENGLSFAYYGGHFARAAADQPNAYCAICNPFQYASDVMGSASARAAHVKDTTQLHLDIQNGILPAVAYAKPDGLLDGHPASSKLDLFEGFVRKIVTELQANEQLWKETAVFVTFDEGGGFYDSGYIQPLDYFGDGPRIPLIIVSKYSKGGNISHEYSDHVSILKFIERNWSLSPITTRSRDNFANPIASPENPYVPLNGPAISDLFDMFDFHGQDNP